LICGYCADGKRKKRIPVDRIKNPDKIMNPVGEKVPISLWNNK
jgi:hypothetical protein